MVALLVLPFPLARTIANLTERGTIVFGFGKKKSKADAAIAAMPQAIERAAEKWAYFCETLVFKAEVPLVARIGSFLVPFEEDVRKNMPALRDAPGAVILLVVAKGIERSGTHSRAEIEEALGFPLPD